MKKTAIKKIISVFLTILMIFSAISAAMPVFAEEINSLDYEEYEPDSEAEVITEDEDLRTSNSRTYILSDGSFRLGVFTHGISNSSNRARRANSQDVGNSEIDGTYIKSTDTADTTHDDEELIRLSSNSYGVIDISDVSSLNNYYVKTVNLYLPVVSGTVGQMVYAYALDESFSKETDMTYSRIRNHLVMIDYAQITSYGDDGNFVEFDVTSVLRSCSGLVVLSSTNNISLGKENNLSDETDSLFMESGAPKIAFSYNYIVTAGLDSDFEYESYDLGSAGNVYINMQSGNLVIKREDISTGNGENAFDISSTFNSMSTAGNGTWFQNHEAILFFYGLIYIDENGTFSVLNYENEVTETIDGVTTTTRYLADNDYGFSTLQIVESTSHEFVLFPGTRLERTITISSATKYLLTADEGKTRYIYTSEYGLTSIEVLDENNEWKMIIGKAHEADDNTENASIITDADGNYIRVTKTDSSLTMTQIKDDGSNGDVEVFYKDEDDNLTSVSKNNHIVATYTYDDNRRMITATDDKGHKLTFGYGPSDYDEVGNEIINYKIVSIQESYGTILGKYTEINYNYDVSTKQTAGANGVFGDSDDLITKYTFDNNCRINCISNQTAAGENLNNIAYSYKDDNLSYVSSSGKISNNYILNHNIESLSNWTEGRTSTRTSVNGTTTLSSEESFAGTKSLKITTSDFASTNAFGRYQEFNVGENEIIKPGKAYVASAYIKIDTPLLKDTDCDDDKNYGANVLVQKISAGSSSVSNVYSQTMKTTNGEWQRVFVPFTAPESGDTIRVYFMVRNALGTAYFDAASLETGKVPEEYNFIENNDFSHNSDSWNTSNVTGDDGVENGAFVIHGDISESKYIRQDINLGNAKQTDKYVLSAVAKASSAPLSKASFAIRARVYYADGTNDYCLLLKSFNAYSQDQQYVQTGFDLSTTKTTSDPVKIRVYFRYSKNINEVEIDSMNLIKTEQLYDFLYKTTVEKDEAGNVIRKTDEFGNVTNYTYNNNKVCLSKTTHDSEGNLLYSATYNALGKILTENDNGINSVYTYQNNKLSTVVITDTEQNITTKTYTDGVISGVQTVDSDNNTIYSETYDDSGELTRIVDNGVTTDYSYLRNSFGDITSVTTSVNGTEVEVVEYTYSEIDSDGDGINDKTELVSSNITDESGIRHFYDSNDNLIREEKEVEGSTVILSEYTYDQNGRLTSKTEDGKTINYNYNTNDDIVNVSLNGQTYSYTYNAFGDKTNVKIGNQTLASYSYLGNNGPLSQTTYGNGDTEKYTYNNYGQVLKLTQTGLGSFGYYYDSKGTLVYKTDNVNSHKTYYYYDESGRKTGEHVISNAQSNAYANDIYDIGIQYNDEGDVAKKIFASNNLSVSDDYTYAENQNATTFTSTRGVTADYDDEGNLITRTISTTTPFVQSYAYDDNGQITAETTGTDNYSYSYDDDGRITEISLNNTVRQSYEYDSDGQLLRENNLDTNKTVIYNYDGYGNILSKVNYPYSTGDVEAALSTENYAYGDNNWKDKLTSYNGELISYDAIGNPTSYRGAVCTYYGRQLMSYSKDGTSISYSYDSDGLRTSKTVNGVKHDYYYVDGILVYEKVGDEYELFYRYDADGKLSFISRKRFSDNNVSSFSVVTNSQGDVIRILSGSGSVSAEYKYDAWGNLISVKNGSGTDVTSSAHIGLQNSVRYRGYVYDSETNLYYLQSRYYDPQTGRLINCDDVDYIGYSDTFAGWNGFAYCENNSVNFVDPEGTFIFNTTLIIINPILYYRWSPLDKNGRKYFLEVTKCKNFYNLNKGVDYFISTINYCQKHFFQVDLCIYDKNVNKNKQYLLGFVSSGFIEGFSSLLLDKYKDVFSKNFPLRSTKGLVYEIVLHIYMYYFDLDKSSNYSHSKIIDIDYYKDGLAIEALCSDSNIKKCIDAIKNNKQNSSISYILKSVLKLVK